MQYQLRMKKMIAKARAPPGLRGFPQQRHRVAAPIITWLVKRNNSAPTLNPEAMSDE